ncbi:hypothetical protein ACLK2C_16135 [Escherichia coli]
MLGAQNEFQLVALLRQFILFGAQLELFQLGQMTQFQLEDRFGLGFADIGKRSTITLPGSSSCG